MCVGGAEGICTRHKYQEGRFLVLKKHILEETETPSYRRGCSSARHKAKFRWALLQKKD